MVGLQILDLAILVRVQVPQFEFLRSEATIKIQNPERALWATRDEKR